jgi:hypothetical protein
MIHRAVSLAFTRGEGCPEPLSEWHYMRKAYLRHARIKNRDAQITRLHRCVSHYRVIKDARPGASPISIHERCVTSECVTYLIFGWGPNATNPRCVLRVSVSYF